MDVARKRRIKRDWSAIFAECQHRDMTIKEFCLSKGMSHPFAIAAVRIILAASRQERHHFGGVISLNSSRPYHHGGVLQFPLAARSNCLSAMIATKSCYGRSYLS